MRHYDGVQWQPGEDAVDHMSPDDLRKELRKLRALLLTASYRVPVMHDKGEFALLLRAAGRGEG